MSVRRGGADEDETEAAQKKAARRREGDDVNQDDAILLAQASTGTSADAPVSVGEELLRQAAPVPRSSKPAANTDFFESMFGKDWKLPVAIGGGALALIGLAAGGGGGDNGSANANGADSGNNLPAPAVPSNTWTLSITPAAGPFIQGATVRATVQKLINGGWQDIASTTTVDRSGRMSLKIDKGAVSPTDTLRVVLTDTDGGSDHNDEVAGAQTLGATPLMAIIGSLASDQQVTVNPLTTLAAAQIGRDLSGANIAAVHAALAKAFGISTPDLVHLMPGLLGLSSSANASADSKNYGLALGVISGMAQAQKDAGQPAEQAIGKALEVLAQAFVKGRDGKLSLDLAQIRQVDVEVRNPDGTTKTVGVGLDEGAARLYKAALDRDSFIASAQVPYISVDTDAEKPAGTAPVGIDSSIRLSSFVDGLSLKVSPAAAAKAGDKLTIEFVPVGENGKLLKDKPSYTYDYVLTADDIEKVFTSSASNSDIGFFKVMIPTLAGDKFQGQRQPIASAADSSVYLIGVRDNNYIFNNGDVSYQLRASGSALGSIAGGSRISISSQQINIDPPPSTSSDPLAFSAASTNAAVVFSIALPKEIFWDSNEGPKLKINVNVDGSDKPILVSLADEKVTGGDVLTFKLRLSGADIKGLDGKLSLPADAILFKDGTTITDRVGRTVLRFEGGAWLDPDGRPTTVEAGLGVKTETRTNFRIDTKPPTEPVLNLSKTPDFNDAGAFKDDQVPQQGALNAGKREAGDAPYTAVSNKFNHAFNVSFDRPLSGDDEGAEVRLYVTTGDTGAEFRVATTKIERGPDGRLGAVFNDRIKDANKDKDKIAGSYDQDALDLVEKRLSSKNDGVTVQYFAVVQDKAGNSSDKLKGELIKRSVPGGIVDSIRIDTVAPVEPEMVRLHKDSETGRAGVGSTLSDKITSLATPTIEVKGPVGHLVQIWEDNTATKLLGKAWIPDNTSGVVGVTLNALANGKRTVYVTLTDLAGNVGKGSSFDFEVLKPYAGDFTLKVISQPPHTGFYRAGDVIEASVSMSDRVFYFKNGKSGSSVFIDLADSGSSSNPKTLRAAYSSGVGTDTLKFKYTVQVDDEINTGTIFKATTFLDGTVKELEDVAGSEIAISQLKVKPSLEQVVIDTQAPSEPVIALLPDVLARESSVSLNAAKRGGFTIKSELNSAVELSFFNGTTKTTVLKTVKATSADALPVVLTDADLTDIGNGNIALTASATDVAGNAGKASRATNFILDTVAPTVASATSDGGKAGGLANVATNNPVNFTVVFSEKLGVTPTKDHFVVTNGTVTEVTQVSGTDTSFTVKVTPSQDVTAGNRMELRIKASSAGPLTDVAGNAIRSDSVIVSQAVDTLGPQIRAVSNHATPVKNGDIEFTVRFDDIGARETTGDVGVGNFGATNATVKSVQALDSSRLSYKVVVTPNAGLTGNAEEVTLQFFANSRGGSANGGIITDELGNPSKDNPTVATQVVDVVPPTIKSVKLANPVIKDGNPSLPDYLHAGDTVTVEVEFSEAMKISGLPAMDIGVGTAVRSATFASLSNDNRIAKFSYVITSADTAADGIAVPANTIRLGTVSGAAIADLAGNVARLGYDAQAVNEHFKIDNSSPTITAVQIQPVASGSGLYNAGKTITVAATFSEDVLIETTKGNPDLNVKLGSTDRIARYQGFATDSRKTLLFSYDVQDGDNAPDGVAIPAGSLRLNGAAITDVSGNKAVLTYGVAAANPAFKVDTTKPTVVSIVLSGETDAGGGSNGNYRVGDKVIATVNFSEEVLVGGAGNATINLNVGGQVRAAALIPPQAGNAAVSKSLRFSYTIVAADGSGLSVGANSITPAGVSIKDAAGNEATLTHVAVGADPTIVTVDNTAPRIVSISSPAVQGSLTIDSTLELRAKASEALRPGASITLKLDSGADVRLVRSDSDAALLTGNYKVTAGNNSSALSVTSMTQDAKDRAGNELSTDLPPATAITIGERATVKVDGTAPLAPTGFRMNPASDLGVSSEDGVTSASRPSFSFQGLVSGNTVEVTAKLNGIAQSLLKFTASSAEQTVDIGRPLGDGIYTEVAARQFGPTGNPSAALELQHTTSLGKMEISTAAPEIPTNLIFDAVQDRLTEVQYAEYLKNPDVPVVGTVPRDFFTSIQRPRFNFTGGEDGQTAVLFRDRNGNNRFDDGDNLLGRQLIDARSLAVFDNPASASRGGLGAMSSLSGHYVDVTPENALANGRYTDIKLVLQSRAGAYGTASQAAINGIQINSNRQAAPLQSVTGAAVDADRKTSSNVMEFTVIGGELGTRLKFVADVTDISGKTSAGVEIGSGLLVGGKVNIDTSKLDGRYANFKAIQTYAGTDSPVMAVTKSGGGDLVMNWDHTAPTVSISAPATVTRPGQPVELQLRFSEETKDFVLADIETFGTGEVSNLSGSGLVRTVTFTPKDDKITTGRVQVKNGSFTDEAGNVGQASQELPIAFNAVGTITLSAKGGAVDDTLTATVSDRDSVRPGTVHYTWKVDDVAVSGNDSPSYKIAAADKGKKISVSALYQDGAGANENITSATTDTITGPNAPGQMLIKVNGNVIDPKAAGLILRWGDRVTTTVSDPDGPALLNDAGFRWAYTSGAQLEDVSSYKDFVVSSKWNKGASIDFGATYTDALGNSESLRTATFTVLPDLRAGTVTLSRTAADKTGPLKIGEIIEAKVEDINEVNGPITYHWFFDGAENTTLTSTSADGGSGRYTVTAADYSKQITVKSVYTDKANTSESPTSAGISVEAKPDNKPVTGDVTIGGEAKLGSLLTAANTLADEDGLGQITYKWFAGSATTPISNAHFQNGDASKLIVSSDLLGKEIRVEASFTDGQGTSEKKESAAMAVGAPDSFSFGAAKPFGASAKLIKPVGTTGLYILDVNGDGAIDQSDATTFTAHSIGLTTASGTQATATLLSKDDARWTTLPPAGIWGSANGAKGAAASGATPAVPGGDFWTASPGSSGNSHFVWTNDPAGPYAVADASFRNDPNRLHYNVFAVSVMPA